VAAHLEPEILLVDEVLAVGDAAFQEKCLGKMSEVAASGRTVVFVSHNMSAIRGLCSRAVLLGAGRVQRDGPTDAVVQSYLAETVGQAMSDVPMIERTDRGGKGHVLVTSVQARNANGTREVRVGRDAEVLIGYASKDDRPISALRAELRVFDMYGMVVSRTATRMTPLRDFHQAPPHGQIVCRLQDLMLAPGRYLLGVALKDSRGTLDRIDKAIAFDVVAPLSGEIDAVEPWGNVLVRQNWDVTPWQPDDSVMKALF
jgi:lipopolysaccharide transport system ATP-binding protein